MAGRIHHWKHGWIPLDSVALAEKGNGHPSPRLRAEVAASALLAKKAKVEPTVTAELQSLAQQTGGTMVGLPFRLKTKKSLIDKLVSKAEQRGTTPEAEAARVADVLRYTMTFPHGDYTAGVKRTAAALKAKGYKVDLENTWPTGAVYKGINGNLTSPSGEVFELQFHTPQSFEQKEGQHVTGYEVLRDPHQPVAARRAAYDAMTQAWKKITVPAAVEGIPTVIDAKAVRP